MKNYKAYASVFFIALTTLFIFLFQNCTNSLQPDFGSSTEGSQDSFFQSVQTAEEPNADEYEDPLASPVSAPPAGSCARTDITMGFPLLGVQDRDWYVSAHFDQNSLATYTMDYTGAKNDHAITYDGHKGLDLALFNFAVMDSNVPVLAVTDGVVETATDGNFDRNTSKVPGAIANLVTVRHMNGFLIMYAHLKNGSVRVVPNQQVRRGDLIGFVGSSGQSSGPHLHLDIKDCAGQKLDLLRNQFFENPPGYLLKRIHLGSFLRTNAPFTSAADLLNASGESIRSARVGARVYYAASYLNIRNNDVISERFFRPSGTLAFENRIVVSGARSVYTRFNKWNSFVLSDRGNWTIRYTVNNIRVGNDLIFTAN